MGADTIVRNAWKKLTKKGANVRITKKMLSKSNERKNVVIFILLAVVFVLSMIESVEFIKLKKEVIELNKTAESVLKDTREIIGILTLTEEK